MKHARKDYNRIQDPLGIIPEDEPVFLVRAQDISSADTIEFWATRNEELGGDPESSRLARLWAKKMRDWPTHKPADLPKESEVEKLLGSLIKVPTLPDDLNLADSPMD